jgi:hypothetical protein
MLAAPSLRHVSPASAAVTDLSSRKTEKRLKQERQMSKKLEMVGGAVALTALAALAMVSFAAPADAAVVYCKTAGVPQGCIVRPTVMPVVRPVPVIRPRPVTVAGVTHVGVTRVTPYGVAHVGYNRVRVWR